MITTLFQNFYWLGVFVAAISIYSAIWIYKTILTNPYEYKNNPYILLFLILSFLSWYALAILFGGLIIAAAVGLVIWIIQSIHHDFFDNSQNM